MKLNPKRSLKENPDAMKCSTALRKLANFCNTYKPADIDNLSSRLFGAVVGQNYSKYPNRTKARILDYFEAMEEVLPALYDLHDHLLKLSKYAGEQATYEQQIAYRRLIASLKSEN